MSKKTFKLIAFLLFAVFALVACTGADPQAAVQQSQQTPALVSSVLATTVVGSSLLAGLGWLTVTVGLAVAAFTQLPLELKRYRVGSIVGVVFVMTTIAFALWGYTPIDAGAVGVQVRQGKAVATLEPGGHFIVPFFDTVHIMSTRQWTYITLSDTSLGDEEFKDVPVDLITQDGVQAQAKYTIQGQLDPSHAIQVYQNYGSLENAIAQLVKHPSRALVRSGLQKFQADELYLEVDAVEEEIASVIRQKMEDGGLVFIFFGFRKPELGIDGDYEAQLNEAQVAEKAALVAQQQVSVTEAEARQAVAVAEGEKRVAILQAEAEAQATLAREAAQADASLYRSQQDAAAQRVSADAQAYEVLAVARATATANELVADSLTAEFIQYTLWQNWDGALPRWVTGEGSMPLVTVPIPE